MLETHKLMFSTTKMEGPRAFSLPCQGLKIKRFCPCLLLLKEKSSPGNIRACLELIRVFAPGSESHTAVSVKYESVARARFELAEFLAQQELVKQQAGGARRRPRGGAPKMKLRRGGIGSGAAAAAALRAKELADIADEATELYLEAFFTRCEP